jgi:hypothetical protein
MPITKGIQCAYCPASLPSDSTMQLHLKQHADLIKSADKLRETEDGKRNRKRRNEAFSEY